MPLPKKLAIPASLAGAVKTLLCVASTAVASLPAPASAEATALTVAGVTFERPVGVVPAKNETPTVKHFWQTPDQRITVAVAELPLEIDTSEAIATVRDWPSAGQRLIDGFGLGYTKLLLDQHGVECIYTGTPHQNDVQRAAMSVQVFTSCTAPKGSFAIISRLIRVFTASKQVVFRVDSESEQEVDAEAAKLHANLWRTLSVNPEARIFVTTPPSYLGSAMVTRGIRFEDYGTLNSASLAGEALGSLLSGLVVGALLTLILLKLRLSAGMAAVIPQVLLALLRIWGDEADGVWTLSPHDWIVCTVTSMVLYFWARHRVANNLQGASTTPSRPAS